MAIGSVYGPFIQNDSYNASKLVNRRMIADSADTRHILLNVNPQDPNSESAIENRIDSLMNLLETGTASFDSLAIKFSEDPGSRANGGKYENVTYGQFVPEYNSKIFLDGEIGKLYKIRSSFGWHIIEVLSRSSTQKMRYQVASINLPIIPSVETQDSVYSLAQEFVTANPTLNEYTAAVSNHAHLSLETSGPLKENDFSVGTLGAGESSRGIIKWSYTAKKGEVSPEVYSYQNPASTYYDRYVVAALSEITPPGVPPVAQVQSDIAPEIMNLKKGEKIQTAIQGKDMAAIASQYDVSIDTASRVVFTQLEVANLGNEPKVIAQAFALNVGDISQPIIGNSGVYIIQVTEKPAVTGDPNLPQLRQQISSTTKNLISGKLIEAMKKNATIKDNRSTFLLIRMRLTLRLRGNFYSTSTSVSVSVSTSTSTSTLILISTLSHVRYTKCRK